tara:strand:+ start:1224 stop:1535 length:312 start_codon:yes stop_codon:yes gene_type:complete
MKLKEYLTENMVVHKQFCDRVGINPATLHSILNNNLQPKLKTAISIEKITKGIVSVYDWGDDADDKTKKEDQPRKIAKLIIKKKVKSKAQPKIKEKTRNSASS